MTPNAAVGGNVNVLSGGKYTGGGKIGGNLTMFSGSTVIPGGTNGEGTINVVGNFSQQANSTYIWNALPNGPTSFITSGGFADLAGNLQVNFLGGFDYNTVYPVLHADGGVNGTFANVFNLPSTNNPYVRGGVFYEPFDVYIEFQTIFSEFACSENTQHIANQIDSITNPSTDHKEIINALGTLTPAQLCDAFNSMAGEQYTFLIQLARYSNERFNQAIYNTIRSTLIPCWCPDPCDRIQTWFQAETGHCFAGDKRTPKG